MVAGLRLAARLQSTRAMQRAAGPVSLAMIASVAVAAPAPAAADEAVWTISELRQGVRQGIAQILDPPAVLG